LTYGLDDFALVGKTAGLMFGIDELSVQDHIENPVRAFDELRLGAELFFDPGRQTGGFGQVVSRHAVGDGDPHFYFPPFTSCGNFRGPGLPAALPAPGVMGLIPGETGLLL